VKDRDLAVLFLALNTADCWLTLHILGEGGRELNPVMASLISYGPAAFIAVKLGFGLVAAVVILKHRPVILKYLVLAMATPVVWNLYHMTRTS
jgi:hypothetical protein